MCPSANKTSRTVQILDHLWDLFEEVGRVVGSDRDSLINQAMFVFARLNGFLEVPAGGEAAGALGAPGERLPELRGERGAHSATASAGTAEESFTAQKYLGLDAQIEAALPADEPGAELFLTSSDGRREKVTKSRFIIGRGRHCDFVIDSGKVSREHAAVIREGLQYFIEDLNSSNGTFFNKQRIGRQEIEHGDQYLICNERITFTLEWPTRD
jgi:hypothetical protein